MPQNGVEPERLSPTRPYATYARVDQPDIAEGSTSPSRPAAISSWKRRSVSDAIIAYALP